MFPTLAAMILTPLILVVMAFRKQHYFVANTLLLMMVPFLLIISPAFFPQQRGVREAAQRMLAASNLRNAVIAMHNYHNDHDHLPPPAITASDGTPHLSWRVIILPYLGHDALYKEFHLNEPWDSEHNRKLIPSMPDIYKSVGTANCPDHHTFIQAFVGPGAMLDPSLRPRTLAFTYHQGLNNIPLVAEGGHPVTWTKPEDIPVSIEKTIGTIGGQFPSSDGKKDGRVHITFADGSIRSLRPPFPMEALRELVQVNSKKQVKIDWE